MEAAQVMSASRPRVLIVEDHEFFRHGLCSLLSRRRFDVIGAVGSAEQAFGLVEAGRPQLVVMDLHLPGMSGAEATARLSCSPSPPTIVMLTVSDRSADLYRALAAGAAGYLLKDTPGDDIARSLHAAARGQSPVSPELSRALVERVRDLGAGSAVSVEGLTTREREVLRELARGLDNGAIAARLGIAPNTVKTHVAAILSKLGVENRIQAATLAVRRRLV